MVVLLHRCRTARVIPCSAFAADRDVVRKGRRLLLIPAPRVSVHGQSAGSKNQERTGSTLHVAAPTVAKTASSSYRRDDKADRAVDDAAQRDEDRRENDGLYCNAIAGCHEVGQYGEVHHQSLRIQKARQKTSPDQ